MDQDPSKLFLAELGLLEHERTFGVLLEQAAALRRADPPDVESYAVAGLGLLMAMEAVPADVVTKTIVSLSKLSDTQIDEAPYVSIVNGALLSLPEGIYDIATMQKLTDVTDLRTLKAFVYNFQELWQIAKRLLSEPPAPSAVES